MHFNLSATGITLCHVGNLLASPLTHISTRCSRTRWVHSLPLGHDLINSIFVVTSPQAVSLDDAGHIDSACGNAGPLSEFNENQLWTIVGEWTPAMTDCAKYLNGRGVGARYDGSISSGAPRYGSCVGKTGKGSTFSPGYRDFLRKVWEAQVSPHIPLVLGARF